ncbi:hypothetical protein C8Q77DRAFT_1122793 [Trametes polyzona]|nr:hypothetical protein C8Q77DRAFT_1122793 [Trametes polyzona]
MMSFQPFKKRKLALQSSLAQGSRLTNSTAWSTSSSLGHMARLVASEGASHLCEHKSTWKSIRPSSNAGRRAVGFTSELQILALPFDVWWKICAYSGLYELLQLSRTSKALRTYLLSRGQRKLWSLAWQNLEGLPVIPPHVSEIAFANFVYTTDCENCAAPYSWNLVEGHLLRLCDDCYRSETVTFSEAIAEYLHFQPLYNPWDWACNTGCIPKQRPLPGRFEEERLLWTDVVAVCQQLEVFAAYYAHSEDEGDSEGKGSDAPWKSAIQQFESIFDDWETELEDVVAWVRKQDERRREGFKCSWNK